MNIEEIRKGAPDGSTHYDVYFDDIFYKFSKSNWYIGFSGTWCIVENYPAFWSNNYFNMKPL